MNNDIIVRNWVSQCPYVQDSYAVRHGVKKLEYGIYPGEVRTTYRENVLGEMVLDEIQNVVFVLTAEIQYVDGNAERYNFYQNILDWVEEQNRIHNVPNLNNGRVRYATCASPMQYVSEPNNNMERAEIQIRFTIKRNT